MKLIKKTIGIFIILGLFSMCFWANVITNGLLTALLRVVSGLVCIAVICIGLLLIFDD